VLVTEEALRAVDEHWAVMAVGEKNRDRGLLVAKARLVLAATGRQMELAFKERASDADVLDRLAMAYEVAATEGLDALLLTGTPAENESLVSQAQAGAWRTFEIRRLIRIPDDTNERIFHVLHLASLAYCGDRWSDLRRWIKENSDALRAPSVAKEPWDKRVLYRLFACWIRLFRKNSWDDLHRIHEIIAGLREDQAAFEEQALNTESLQQGRVMALRLVSLYHWARATELLATYILQGTPAGINAALDRHFEQAIEAAPGSRDPALEVLLKWMHVASRRMVAGSIWWVAGKVNSRVSKFVKSVTEGSQALFELLPPQRVALQEQGLLDQAAQAIVIDMPTSGGKTLLAEFRMLQALNQFDQDKGWVAYVAPTRALVSQITRRLRKDLEPFGVMVEQLTGAIEIDVFEDSMLTSDDPDSAFDILVCTPEKLQLVLRNDKIAHRPLALCVLDEAHNIEDTERGLRIELLLATIRRECDRANFLLLMPYVPNSEDIANWLGQDSGKAISIGTSAWKPNERIVGMFHANKYDEDKSVRAGWRMAFKTLVTTPNTIHLKGEHPVDGSRPLNVPWSSARNAVTVQAGAMAKVFSERGTSIAIATNTNHVWSMARKVAEDMPLRKKVPEEIKLVQRFLKTEIGDDFELIGMLDRGVAVHHSGLSDEIRSLVEWLAEEQKLKVLCATTTIAQGINFPVSSVFLASYKYPYGQPMSPREFWNLAGRAGRFGQDSVGVVGLARGDNEAAIKQFVSQQHQALASRLVGLLNDVADAGELQNLQQVIAQDEWRDFRCYVAHLMRESGNLESVLAETDELLRSTYGYSTLRSTQTSGDSDKADALLRATRGYVHEISKHPENVTLADSTGFAPEGVRTALLELRGLEDNLTPADWEPSSLFGSMGNSSLPDLIGVMLRVGELQSSLEEIGQAGTDKQQIANLTSDWVNGKSLREIAEAYFQDEGGNITTAVSKACKAIYRNLCNSGPWGMSALSKMPTSGLDFDNLPADVVRRINSLPSMIYHGVRTEPAVLLRMNSVPRTVAEPLGRQYESDAGSEGMSVKSARDFLRSLSVSEWKSAAPRNAVMSGADYRDVWYQLSGETKP
jgi:superfamily II DNA/RNA helicase